MPYRILTTVTYIFSRNLVDCGGGANRSPVQKRGLREVDKYQIAAAILEKLFYAYLFFVVAVCVVICLVCQYYDVPAPVWPW